MEKQILVAGGGGFTRSYAAKRLYEEGYFVRVVDIQSDSYFEKFHYSEKLTLGLRPRGKLR